jgi:polar amino acid transport system permease protein
MLPPFGNLIIELLKATALVSLITIPDITFRGVSLQQTTGRTVEIFLLAPRHLLRARLPADARFVRWIERRASAFRGA